MTPPHAPTRHLSRPRHAAQAALALLVLPGLVGLAGCGARVDDAESGSQVSLTNCGVRQTYDRPTSAIAYDVSSIEKIFALGLADKLRGMVLPKTAQEPAERSTYAKDYAATENLSTDVLSLETVVDARADFVLAGWNSGFSEERGITPERLEELGIDSYQHTESCFEYGKEPVRTEPLEALYTDLRQLGAIFGVPERAEKLNASLERRFAALAAKRTPGSGPRTFLYDSGTQAPYTSGAQGMPHVVIEKAGARNIFAGLDKRWTEVGWEAVATRDPEVILVVDYGDLPVAQKIATLRSTPALAQTPAVRHDRFHVVDYGEVVSGPRNIDAAEKFAAYLEREGL